jgi:hypothetical protein
MDAAAVFFGSGTQLILQLGRQSQCHRHTKMIVQLIKMVRTGGGGKRIWISLEMLILPFGAIVIWRQRGRYGVTDPGHHF